MALFDYSPGIAALTSGVSKLGEGLLAAGKDKREAEALLALIGQAGQQPTQAPQLAAPQLQAPKQPTFVRETGVPQDLAALFDMNESRYGLPTGYLAKTAAVESNYDPNAKNKRSSAGGLFQQTDGNAKQYGVLNRFDPAQSTEGAARFAADNMKALKAATGRDPTVGELYLAHQQGPGGAVALLRNPNANVIDALSAAYKGDRKRALAAVINNGGSPDMTAAQFAQRWTGKFGDAPAVQQATAAPQPQQQPQPVSMAEAGVGGIGGTGTGGLPVFAGYEGAAPRAPSVGTTAADVAAPEAAPASGFFVPPGPTPAAPQQAAPVAPSAPTAGAGLGVPLTRETADPATLQAIRQAILAGGTARQLGVAMLQQIMTGKGATQLQFQKDDNGNIVALNPQTGAAQIVHKGSGAGQLTSEQRNYAAAVQGGYAGTFNDFMQQGKQRATNTQIVTRTNPDGTTQTFSVNKETNVATPIVLPGDAGSDGTPGNPYALGGKPSGEQSRDAGFARRMIASEEGLRSVAGQGTSGSGRALEYVPFGLGNFAQSKEYQSFAQFRDDFINAQLRRESGAAISASEYKNADKQYFPVPGDKPEVVRQKQLNRQRAIEAMFAGAGAAYIPDKVFDQTGNIITNPGAKRSAPQNAPANFSRDELLAEARRRGLVQ